MLVSTLKTSHTRVSRGYSKWVTIDTRGVSFGKYIVWHSGMRNLVTRYWFFLIFSLSDHLPDNLSFRGSRAGAMVIALASNKRGPAWATSGLSWLLVLYSAPRGFFPGSPVFPSPQKSTCPNSNSIGCRTSLKATSSEWSFLGKYH